MRVPLRRRTKLSRNLRGDLHLRTWKTRLRTRIQTTSNRSKMQYPNRKLTVMILLIRVRLEERSNKKYKNKYKTQKLFYKEQKR